MIFSDTFYSNAVLIMLTALLTGLLVPIIKANMDQRRFREQRIFEQELARQGKRIEAQARMLEDLGAALWEFQLLALEPAYFRLKGSRDTGEVASRKYDEQAMALLGKIRSEIGHARTLASPEMHQKLLELYQRLLLKLDPWLSQLEENSASTRQDWQSYHDFVFIDVVREIEELMNGLAWDIGLAAPSNQRSVASK